MFIGINLHSLAIYDAEDRATEETVVEVDPEEVAPSGTGGVGHGKAYKIN